MTRTRLTAKQIHSFRLMQVVSILQMTPDQLETHLVEAAQDNPLLVIHRRGLRRWQTGSAGDLIQHTTPEAQPGLHQHAMCQLSGLLGQGGMLARLVIALIEELEPSGWLGAPLARIAADLGLAEQVVETALMLVQKRIEPTGLFARDLQECLRLQLQEGGLLDQDMARVLDHLPLLEQRGVAGLAAAAGLTPDRATRCLNVIRQMNPKPGAAFAQDTASPRAPDVVVTPSQGGWHIRFTARLHEDVELLALPCGPDGQALRAAQTQARALKQALEMRHSAMRKVVHTLVTRQGDFFRDGALALRPLTMQQVAAEAGFHLSTVSRVLNGLLIEGPNGIITARDLCPGAAKAGDGDISRPKVVARLRQMLKAEDPATPLTDQQMADLMADEGLTVSRRIVAKYRQSIGISAAAQRRDA